MRGGVTTVFTDNISAQTYKHLITDNTTVCANTQLRVGWNNAYLLALFSSTPFCITQVYTYAIIYR